MRLAKRRFTFVDIQMRRLVPIVSTTIGFVLFIYVIKQTGLEEIGQRLRQLGAGFLLILLISAVRYLTRSLSWLWCITPEKRTIGFWNLWRARLAGEALGDLTVGPIVAEPLRLIALGDRLELSSGVSSLALENLTYAASSCVMVMVGAVALLKNFGLHQSLRTAMLAALAAVVLVVLSSSLVIARRWRIESVAGGLISFLIRDAAREKIRTKLVYIRDLENYIFDFFRERPADFLLVMLCHVAFHVAGIAEIFVTMRLIGAHLAVTTAFLMETVNRAINIAFVFIPALVGIDELSTRELAKVLGFDGSFGVAVAVIRKIRMFFWIGIGLLCLGRSRKKHDLPIIMAITRIN
jgi:Lysylphosphatidylglycerol synthase TM region